MNAVFAMGRITNPIEAKLILLEGYDTATGAYDHHAEEEKNKTKPIKNINPFAIIGFHKANDACRVTQYSELMKIFAHNKIKDVFGINFLQFLDLPRVRIHEMIATSKEIAEEEKERMEKLRQELEDAKQNLDNAKPGSS